MTVKVMFWVVVIGVAAAAAAWSTRDSVPVRGLVSKWLPGLAAGPSTPRSTADKLTAERSPRKCVGAGQVLYTDEACPPGTRAQALSGGGVSVLPAAPAAPAVAAPPPQAASAQTPLRRLAGQGAGPDAQNRLIDQALQR